MFEESYRVDHGGREASVLEDCIIAFYILWIRRNSSLHEVRRVGSSGKMMQSKHTIIDDETDAVGAGVSHRGLKDTQIYWVVAVECSREEGEE